MAEARQPEIKVELAGEGAEVRPDSVEVGGRREKVDAVLASWTEGGQGPSGRFFSNRLNRTYFRLRLKDGSVYEVAHELPENRKAAARWVLVQQLQAQPAEAKPASASDGKAAKPTPKATSSPRSTAAKPTPAKRVAGKSSNASKKAPARTAKAKKG